MSEVPKDVEHFLTQRGIRGGEMLTSAGRGSSPLSFLNERRLVLRELTGARCCPLSFLEDIESSHGFLPVHTTHL